MIWLAQIPIVISVIGLLHFTFGPPRYTPYFIVFYYTGLMIWLIYAIYTNQLSIALKETIILLEYYFPSE